MSVHHARLHLCIVTAAAVTAGVIVAARSPQAPQKPTVVQHFATEDRGSLGSIPDMWQASDVVVEGVIEAEHPTDYDKPTPQISTTYDVRIIEVFKSSADVTSQTGLIPVRRRGGTRDKGDKFVTLEPDSYPLFKRGERYIFFLVKREWAPPAPYTGIYYAEATKTADSAFKVTAGGLASSGKGRLSTSVAGTQADQLRSLLRREGRR